MHGAWQKQQQGDQVGRVRAGASDGPGAALRHSSLFRRLLAKAAAVSPELEEDEEVGLDEDFGSTLLPEFSEISIKLQSVLSNSSCDFDLMTTQNSLWCRGLWGRGGRRRPGGAG